MPQVVLSRCGKSEKSKKKRERETGKERLADGTKERLGMNSDWGFSFAFLFFFVFFFFPWKKKGLLEGGAGQQKKARRHDQPSFLPPAAPRFCLLAFALLSLRLISSFFSFFFVS
jgi:hypothetical protein